MNKDKELIDEIYIIFEKYEEDFNLEEISKDFYNIILREKQEARKEILKEEIKFLEKLRNKKASGRFVYETKDIDNRIKELKSLEEKEK
jgi:hypothetical protein